MYCWYKSTGFMITYTVLMIAIFMHAHNNLAKVYTQESIASILANG